MTKNCKVDSILENGAIRTIGIMKNQILT